MKKKTVKITTEDSKVVYTKKNHVIEYPCFCKDQYGFYNGCLDGKSTIVIGLNGVQCNKKDTHSIETRNYVARAFVESKSTPISKEQFKGALELVMLHVEETISTF